MKIENTTVYVAEDGKKFTTEPECIAYEEKVIKRRKALKYFRVIHSPDLNEGRGNYGLTYFAIDSTYYPMNVLMDYCFYTFGRPIDFIQGCQETSN